MDQILGQRPVRPLGEDRHLRSEVVARLVIRLGLTISAEPLVARPDAGDLAALTVDDLGAASVREDGDPELGLVLVLFPVLVILQEPGDKLAQFANAERLRQNSIGADLSRRFQRCIGRHIGIAGRHG